ncbi:MAG: MlaD family protein [Solirubrobacteraceae bacterium]|nr:MlaD family protein [Solirubrobacteraceae bacterium]
MRRALVIAAVLLGAAVLVGLATRSGSDGGYRVRAIFDNAAFLRKGMDVRVAGVTVGAVASIDLTADKKAAVVLDITDSGHQDFRTDAFCTIRPQSLIGERFVECQTTQPRGPDEQPPPELATIDHGPGEGERLLPVTRTARSVDLDLINNIMRLPYRERLTIFVNELGTGLAANGEELGAALKKSDPALRALDDVLAILSDQNRTLERLAVDGDRVLAPLARRRERVTGFISSAGRTAAATAERSGALREDLRRLPAFLRELGPTMDELGALSDQFTPVLSDLGRSARPLNAFVTGTPAFARAGVPALQSLGDTADVGGPALQASLPLVKDLGTLGRQAVPLSSNLSDLLVSLRDRGAINRLMDAIYFGAGSMNGYDQYGRYLRARLVTTSCQSYFIQPDLGCDANFREDVGDVPAPARSSSASTAVAAPAPSAPLTQTLLSAGDGTRRGAGAAPAAGERSGGTPDRRSAQALLDYLLGE